MSYDLLIKNGTVVDGTGSPRRMADVAVEGGVIAEIGKVSAGAARVIDADGLIVAPGFIDPHTHYDAQICWDKQVTSSSWHGVTSVVMGNCGVGLAPCRPQVHDIAAQDLVNVEGIPFDVLKRGITWDWESFPSYMEAAGRRGSAINLSFLAPLTPFRHYVMGEESMDRAATPQETEKIAALLREAVAAGALGFSHTTGIQHVGYKGRPLACRLADRAELGAYARVLRDLGKGVIEITLTQNFGHIQDHELDLLGFLLDESGRRVTWLAIFDRDDQPLASAETLQRSNSLIKRGGIPQMTCRPLITEFDLKSSFGFSMMKAWQPAVDQPPERLKQIYADPDFRRAVVDEMKRGVFRRNWERMEVCEAGKPELRKLVGKSVGQIARERGRAGQEFEMVLDLAIEDDLNISLSQAVFNTNEERLAKLINDPRPMIGLSDAGAHVNLLCDAGYCTYLLGHFVRDLQAITLEYAVKRITSEPADFFGLNGRGRLAAGNPADIAIFDADKVGSPRRGTMKDDLPGGGKRLVMPATGVVHTVVNGTMVYEDGRYTGATPGEVLRSQA
ncbi:MAG TPA: amidohydrolase family protein [Candidatus Binataceae bacterium]|nr:amidohydrolase family protein [Candidatus Binataceae bacterium]